jgi:replicative DNA helicase
MANKKQLTAAELAAQAERAALGTVLAYPGQAAVLNVALARCWEMAWADPGARLVAAALRRLLDADQPVSPRSIRAELAKQGQDPELAGDILRCAQAVQYMEGLCEEIRANCARRVLVDACARITAQVDRVPPTELIDQLWSGLALAGTATAETITAGPAVADFWASFQAARERGSAITGLATQIPELDAATGGLQSKCLYILGARPSHGKSALASQIALNLMGQGVPALYCMHEMSSRELIARMACQMARVNFSLLTSGRLNQATTIRLMDSLDKLKQMPLRILDDADATPQQCQAEAEVMRQKHGAGIVIVDYLQLERIPGFGGVRAEEIAQISGSWRRCLKRTGHSGLILSQLNRGGDDTEPRLAHLRDSGAIEQDAHAVILLNRPGRDSGKPAYRAIINLAKNRNGPVTNFPMYFEGFSFTFGPWHSSLESIPPEALAQSEQRAIEAQQA